MFNIKKITHVLLKGLLVLSFLFPVAAFAANQNQDANRAPASSIDMVQSFKTDSNYCDEMASRVETVYGIPQGLLASISIVESGVFVSKKGVNGTPKKVAHAWPWTIQVKGKGYFFATKAEAIAAAQYLLDHNIRNFDVGCTQVNMMYHADAFKNLDEAFDPITNMKYAATFFKQYS